MKPTNSFSTVICLLIKWSGIAAVDGRGKVGGSVFSKSRAGATVRNKSTPINRRSPAQSLIRGLLSAFAQGFRNLTAAQINAWNALANSGLTQTNIFGDTFHMTGINLYARSNINLAITANAAISDAPDISDTAGIILGFEPLGDVSAVELFAKTEFFGGSNNVPANNSLVVYATPPLSQGIKFVRSQLTQLFYMNAADPTDTTNLWPAYIAKYGAPVAGANVVLAVQLINADSGFSGTPIQARANIVA